ncbi:MAG: DUF1249 domain-containing protein [Candidatus Competibacteraceae bacterium]|nr:MAG: DUF1249 domain-containing protein [Candidatus Competibacteraceae bacterium]
MILLHAPQTGLLAHDTPGSFAALMDLYERNYINLRRLLPIMPPASTACVSRVVGGLDLHLRILERSRYTSGLTLTYQFHQDDGTVTAEPNLRIRIYHDARMAEVMAAHLRHRAAFAAEFHPGHQADDTHLHARWRTNRFLFKWLAYCLRQGHRFTGQFAHPV